LTHTLLPTHSLGGRNEDEAAVPIDEIVLGKNYIFAISHFHIKLSAELWLSRIYLCKP